MPLDDKHPVSNDLLAAKFKPFVGQYNLKDGIGFLNRALTPALMDKHGGPASQLIPFALGQGFSAQNPDEDKPEGFTVGPQGLSIYGDNKSLMINPGGSVSFQTPGFGVNASIAPDSPSFGINFPAFGGTISADAVGGKDPGATINFASNPGPRILGIDDDSAKAIVDQALGAPAEKQSGPSAAQQFLAEQIAPLMDTMDKQGRTNFIVKSMGSGLY